MMDKSEYNKIMSLFESHLQVKKLSAPGTIRLYKHSVQMFFTFCGKFKQDLMLPQNLKFENLGVRELESFINFQIEVLHWKKSTLVTCVSGIKVFFQYLTDSNYLAANPIQHFKIPRIITEIGQQKYEIDKINKLFNSDQLNNMKGYQQRLLLELIYGLGLSLKKIVKIENIIPELDEGRVRLYFKNSEFKDYPFNPSAISFVKSYLKQIDNINGKEGFWIKNNGKRMTSAQLQTLLNNFFEDHDFPAINANVLRDLSVQHFSIEGADIRSIQSLRQVKQIRRFQALKQLDFDRLQTKFREIHSRSSKENGNKNKF